MGFSRFCGPRREGLGFRLRLPWHPHTRTPIPGAWVHLQGSPHPGTFTDSNGVFYLPVHPAGTVMVTAAVPYLRGAPENYLTGGSYAVNGQMDIEIRLEPLPLSDDASYLPASFSVCEGCHSAQAAQWQASRHAFTATNAWVRDLFSGDGTPGGSAGYVFKNLHDPGETGFCATCHAPMRDRELGGTLMLDDPSMPDYGLEGVNCVTCHQLDHIDSSQLEALHHLGKAFYRFPYHDSGSTFEYVWGPLDDVTFGGMRASYSTLHRQSLLCASCHQYSNPENGTPGQTTFTEWQASPFAVPGPNFRTCQDCHMPASSGSGTNCLFGGVVRPGSDRREHSFVGTTPETLQANVGLVAQANQVGNRLLVTASVSNFGAGRAFPTGVSIRNAILLLEAKIGSTSLIQTAGPTVPYWADDDVPGKQPGDWAGYPGKGFAKVLEGRINGTGPVVRPVLFIDAEAVAENSVIPSGATDTSVYEFALPAGLSPGTTAEVTVRLLWRRAFRALAVTKGWTSDPRGGPIEIEVHRVELEVPIRGTAPTEIPSLGRWGALLLGALLLGGGVWAVRSKARGQTLPSRP